MARALLVCRDLSSKYTDKEWSRIKDDETWVKMLSLLYDSTHKDEHMWVRTGGLDDAWTVSNLIELTKDPFFHMDRMLTRRSRNRMSLIRSREHVQRVGARVLFQWH